MTRKFPIGKLTETARASLKDPKKAAARAVQQARGAASAGRMVAEHVRTVATDRGGDTVGKVRTLLSGSRRPEVHLSTDAPKTDAPSAEPVPAGLKHHAVPPAPSRPPEPETGSVTPQKTQTRKTQTRKTQTQTTQTQTTQKTGTPSPADVAKKAVHRTPTSKVADHRPAKKKSTPSGKLPPRKHAED